MAVVAGALVDQLVVLTALAGVNRAFSVTNRGTRAGVEQPTTPLRSGGPGSLSAWEDLGIEGRDPVTDPPTASQLAAFAGGPTEVPIRAYVGLQSGGDHEERSTLAVAELERTGAFEREVLMVVTARRWPRSSTVDDC